MLLLLLFCCLCSLFSLSVAGVTKGESFFLCVGVLFFSLQKVRKQREMLQTKEEGKHKVRGSSCFCVYTHTNNKEVCVCFTIN